MGLLGASFAVDGSHPATAQHAIVLSSLISLFLIANADDPRAGAELFIIAKRLLLFRIEVFQKRKPHIDFY